MPDQRLRPLERRMLRLNRDGVEEEELARRFRRSPENVRQVLRLAQLPDRDGPPDRSGELSPLERRVLRWREDGAAIGELSDRFRRGSRHMAQVERMAHYKLAS